MRFTYDPARPRLDQVTEIAVGDIDRGYVPIDITGADPRLYGVTSPLFFPLMVAAIPKLTQGALDLVPKNGQGQPLQSRVEAVAVRPLDTPDVLPQRGTSVDVAAMVGSSPAGGPAETKEWQAIMQHLQALPTLAPGELPVVPTDARAGESRFVRLG
jgi:5'-nucleotidase